MTASASSSPTSTPARRWPRWRRRLARTRVLWPLLAIVVAVALVVGWRTALQQLVKRPRLPVFAATHGPLTVSFKRSLDTEARYLPIKISVPFTETAKGCETIYVEATFGYGPRLNAERDLATAYEERARRAYVRFRSDQRHRRCESKDLLFDTGDTTVELRLQLYDIDVDLVGRRLTETPRKTALVVTTGEGGPKDTAGLRSAEVPSLAPGRSTPLPRKTSTMLSDDQVEAIVAPRESYRDRIVRELRAVADACRAGGPCKRVRGAVAGIRDAAMVAAFEDVAASGADVDLMTNFAPRFTEATDEVKGPARVRRAHPAQVMRGSPLLNRLGRLEMHAKFLVIGDDLVISSNGNYDFHRWPHSREATMVYTSTDVVQIFDQFLASIRTGSLPELTIDERDTAIFLLQHTRPLGTSVTATRPAITVRTTEGLVTTPYGWLFKHLDDVHAPLRIVMSPISNSCAQADRRRCLFPLLADKAKRDGVEIMMNAHYLYKQGARDRNLDLSTARPAKDALPPSLTRLRRALAPAKLRLTSDYSQRASTQHGRWALLGDDELIFGSANWAAPVTINTVEVLRLPSAAGELAEEWERATDPWNVVAVERASALAAAVDGCGFIVERDLLSAPAPRTIPVSAARVAAALGAAVDDVELFDLDWGALAVQAAPGRASLRARPLAEVDVVAAHGVCARVRGERARPLWLLPDGNPHP